MSWELIRTRIKAVLDGIDSVGKVNDYRRHHIDWDKIAENFKDGGRINGWIIDWSGFTPTKEASGSIAIKRAHLIRIWGLYSLRDSIATSKTFENIAEEVVDAFDALELLGGDTRARMEAPAKLLPIEEAMFAGVLCHRCQILLNYSELVVFA